MKNNINLKKLVDGVYERLRREKQKFSKRAINEIIIAVGEVLKQEERKGNSITFRGLGRISTANKKAMHVNSALYNGFIAEHRILKFYPSVTLKRVLNNRDKK